VGPSITYNVWQGMKTLDSRLSEMARAFGVPRALILRRVLLPQTVPFLFAAARFGLALTWKIMIFVELLGRSSGVGYRIQYWYNLFNMERVLASALPFIILMLLIELVILRNLETYLFRWQRKEAQ
jgi:NitT/TauT family transport system permease protein